MFVNIRAMYESRKILSFEVIYEFYPRPYSICLKKTFEDSSQLITIFHMTSIGIFII